MKVLKEYLGFRASALQLREQRNNVIGSNIANAATPNYKARDVDFEKALKTQSGGGDLNRSNQKHYGDIDIATGDTLKYRQNMNPSADGNTVELSVEQMEFSENTVRYMSSLNFLNSRITGLMSAIRGE
ncbi:MAG: flagellar basal body rod protein FlgB [Paracoccaceae bacterium]|mgnify:FL=1|jgi:flagellar basal-body rod protein FlgB|nr:flagellar basal body rod protein FlgB [Paracoccaceae bacterium]